MSAFHIAPDYVAPDGLPAWTRANAELILTSERTTDLAPTLVEVWGVCRPEPSGQTYVNMLPAPGDEAIFLRWVSEYRPDSAVPWEVFCARQSAEAHAYLISIEPEQQCDPKYGLKIVYHVRFEQEPHDKE